MMPNLSVQQTYVESHTAAAHDKLDIEMRTETKTQGWFLADPRTRKWITQCAACQQYGRKSDTPSNIPKVGFEQMFPVQDLDELGLCERCAGYASNV